MLRPTKTLLMRIGAVCILGAAGASAAVAADNTGAIDATANASAALVLDAIAGGTNPSIVAAQRADSESRGQAMQAKGEAAGLISAAQRQGGAGTAGTVGVRPGWGCGDKNHTHSGPPGRPGATPPPGCQR